MCGIAGISHTKGKKIKSKILNSMRDTLSHRGPDGKGSFISKQGKVGLATRRLAIIDPTKDGSQPMSCAPKKGQQVAITYNGEVYNFKEIRKELSQKGYTFRSGTDTEVIMKSYIEWDKKCLQKFNGMFAFVIWDSRKKELFGARDHLGIKPFYYGKQNESFYFGSEIKAILAHPEFSKKLQKDNISQYLTFASTPPPKTLFENIKKLPPAQYIVVNQNNEIKTRKYWDPADSNSYEDINTEEEYIQKIRDILRDSIEKQMVSDVPFGCFLSGGVDSSTNATMMSQALGKPVETFSIGSTAHPDYNEFKYSRKIANMLGANTHERRVDFEDFLNFLPKYPKFADDPNGDQICFLIYYISELIRDNDVIVAQVGEGADELFAGYPNYRLAVNLYENIWKWVSRLPLLRNLPYGILHPLDYSKLDFSKDYARRLHERQEPFWGNAIAFNPTHKNKLLTKKYKETLQKSHEYKVVQEKYESIQSKDPQADFLKKMTYLEIKLRLPEILLMRVDKMSMSQSIEARVPFLDKRLVELALDIPQSLKLKNNTTKYMLKKAVEPILPEDIIYRKKQGFAGPVSEWFSQEDKMKKIKGKIFQSSLRERNLFDYEYIEELLKNHLESRIDNNFKIWNLLSLSLWHDEWFN
ncbi:MAG: asparagine synthase (glutamine-hydrolyzing) [Candidatus Magasanikbacteria bacterium]